MQKDKRKVFNLEVCMYLFKIHWGRKMHLSRVKTSISWDPKNVAIAAELAEQSPCLRIGVRAFCAPAVLRELCRPPASLPRLLQLPLPGTRFASPRVLFLCSHPQCKGRSHKSIVTLCYSSSIQRFKIHTSDLSICKSKIQSYSHL